MDLMEGLSGWLRQVVAVLLLATLIDLLLPNKTMQRYVRLVAGLFVLMTVATPILNWLQGDFSGKLASGLESVEREPAGAGAQLALIEAEGEKLRDGHRLQAEKLVAAKLEAEIASEVGQGGERSVERVAVDLERKPDGELAVAKVLVELKASGDETRAEDGASESVKDVAAIADVDIRIELGEARGDSGGTEEALPAAAEEEAEADSQVARREKAYVAALVAGRFGIPASVVEVTVPSAPRAERN